MGSTKCNHNNVNKTESKKTPTVHYQIFKCKELLRRRKPDFMSVGYSKLSLLETLILIHPNESELSLAESEQDLNTVLYVIDE